MTNDLNKSKNKLLKEKYYSKMFYTNFNNKKDKL